MSAQPMPASDAASAEPAVRAASPRTLREALPVFLRHGSPRILIACVGIAVAARVAAGGWSAWDLVPLVALVLYWPIQEWGIHVFILHAKPRRVFGRTIDLRVPRKHRAHHREPWRLDILFIPMHSFLYTIPILAGVWWLVTPSASLALTGIAAHFALALHYEWVHFLVHTRVTPRNAYYQRLWKSHRRHHFKNENYWFGVTMLSGDRLLGTAPDVADVPTSPTARTLLA
ncbi:MAG: fatty acid hydroxylase [Proteobacteria bacterium]|nr:MAG: fatty acid hydroxylase [Pseudomonadota bacterium]